MANIGVLVPRTEMLAQARQAAAQLGLDLHYIREIETPVAVSAAWEAVEAGTHVLVARGLQARLIQENTDIPLVEVRITGQEMGLLVQKAKQLLAKPQPRIAVIGFANSFSSYNHFNQLFDVDLRVYTVDSMDDLQSTLEHAVAEGAELVIGGDIIVSAAQRMGIPALFNDTTEEAMLEALSTAKKAAFAIDVEKKANVQLDTIMETSLNGVIEIDTEHRITMANQVVQDVTGLPAAELEGKALEELLIGIEQDTVEDILQGRKERATVPGRVHNVQLTVSGAPLVFEEEIAGAIFTFHRMKTAGLAGSERQHEMYRSGHVARVNFSQITRQSAAMRQCIELAKMYALSNSPVVVYGETGTETEMLAQAIHNNSGRRNQPFIALNCFDADAGTQAQFLFGDAEATDESARNGALYTANFGTVFISDIQNLAPACQYRLVRLIRNKSLIRNNIDKAMSLDVRVLCSCPQNLALGVENGTFREDLYHLLSALQILVPPLRTSPGDIVRLAKGHVKENCDKYSKFIELTEDTYTYLAAQEWKGNLIQLERFCELLVLTATKRKLDQGYVSALLAETYPAIHTAAGGAQVTVYKHPEALKIAQVLERHHGNRQAAADEMGISTTTLWRRIKKYGVEEMYKV